ncbi:hypothetical protein Tco_1155020 [Tanacetum coccineum]
METKTNEQVPLVTVAAPKVTPTSSPSTITTAPTPSSSPHIKFMRQIVANAHEAVPPLLATTVQNQIDANVKTQINDAIDNYMQTYTITIQRPSQSTLTEMKQKMYDEMQTNLKLRVKDPDSFEALKKRIEKGSASTDTYRQIEFSKRPHDDHSDDHPKGENAKKRKTTEELTLIYHKIEGAVVEEESGNEIQLDKEMGNDDEYELEEFEIPPEKASLEFLDELKLWPMRKAIYKVRHKMCISKGSVVYLKSSIQEVVNVDVENHFQHDYMAKITVKRADSQKYTFSKADYKYLNLNDIKDMYLYMMEGKLDHVKCAHDAMLRKSSFGSKRGKTGELGQSGGP